MKLLIRITLLTVFLSVSSNKVSQAQAYYSSNYFKNPETLIDFTNDCASFWMGVHDNTYGGFYMDIGRSGNVLNTNRKGIVSLSRNAYGFAKAFMLTGNEDYLSYSESALQFMYDYLWDSQYKGWFSETDRNGSNPSTGSKTAFDQHYALLGITAYFEATGDSSHLSVIDSTYNYMNSVFWDDSPTQFGYYDVVERDGTNPQNKTFNSTLDAVTTHLYGLYLITGEQKYLDRLNDIKGNIIDYFHANMATQSIGFPEEYYSDWSINESEKLTIMGHVLKAGWSLGRMHRINPDQTALDAGKDLVQNVLDKGYDHQYGGPYKDYNRVTGVMEMWGAYDIAKAWWQMEQAITSGLLLFEITWDQKYLSMADESLDFFMNYFVDPVYGEVYADRSRTGGRVAYSGGYWDENKGSKWKAAYHSIETAYYAYLYGKLLLKQEPVTLYYNYSPIPYDRAISFTPLAVDFSKLSISSITLNGNEYTDFNPTSRIVNIPANTGGKLTVSYIMSGLEEVIAGTNELLAESESMINYPNPFRGTTEFIIHSENPQTAGIDIYNISGQLVKRFSNQNLSAGKNTIRWNADNLPEGIYIYKLFTENGSFSGKCILLN